MLTPNEIRSQVTSQIIEALTNGNLPPWRRPWTDDPNAPGFHTSLSSGNPYRGINQLLLQLAAGRSGFQSRWWGTYAQINASGAHVVRGEKGIRVVLLRTVKRTQIDENGEETDDSFCVMRTFVVFNAEQSSGLPQYRVGLSKPRDDTGERYGHADAVIEATDADIRFGGNEAFYRLAEDFIQLPHRHQFQSAEAFYETAFHEMAHWSEHPTRLNWNREGEGYAMGELIAEIASCFVMGAVPLPTTNNMANHAAYVKSWLRGMNDDSRFIFRASAQAAKTADFLLSFNRAAQPVSEPAEDAIPF